MNALTLYNQARLFLLARVACTAAVGSALQNFPTSSPFCGNQLYQTINNMAQVSLQVRTSLDLANARFKGRPSHWLNANALLLGLSSYPTLGSVLFAGDTTISYELILEKFRSIEKPIDKYLTLRDLLRLAPRVYYDLLLKHTEEILPYIYTVSRSVASSCSAWTQKLFYHTNCHSSNSRGAVQHVQRPFLTPCLRLLCCTAANCG
jgi:hypothetical protein